MPLEAPLSLLWRYRASWGISGSESEVCPPRTGQAGRVEGNLLVRQPIRINAPFSLGALGLAVVTAGATLLSRSILVRRAASASEADVVGEMKEAA